MLAQDDKAMILCKPEHYTICRPVILRTLSEESHTECENIN